ncbi:flavodoxin family protein [Neolewinella sp.]|uniref:flavodoxin family protein n=1 Tax=Neolewinella sp. TaxID=2993543 RepID=UPI003B52C32F
MSSIIIVGSARRNGNTAKVATTLAEKLEASIVDLLDYQLSPYRYTADYPTGDQFIHLIETYLLPHDHIVLASPVYWYTMSAQLKVFLDRFSDLLTTHKSLGRQLRGKQLSVLSCSNDRQINESFYAAFRLTTNYLGMNYGREWHGWIVNNRIELAHSPI